jgi:thymidylate synthase (FAD)
MKVELLCITPDAEKLIESAGRTSYLSFNKQGKDTEKTFVRMLIKNGHLSVLEHASATFRISSVSRAFTHQLVRHRLGSFTQQSQRYVNQNNFSYIEPDKIKSNMDAHVMFTRFIDEAQKVYSELQKMGIENEDARFVLPNAVESQIVMTTNFREWRHIIAIRGSRGAQWEIRRMAIEILKIFKKQVPTVFEDFEIDEKNILVQTKKR